jgi:hypothetical protein
LIFELNKNENLKDFENENITAAQADSGVESSKIHFYAVGLRELRLGKLVATW